VWEYRLYSRYHWVKETRRMSIHCMAWRMFLFTPPSGWRSQLSQAVLCGALRRIGFVYGELSKPSGPLPLVTSPRQCPQMFVQMFVARWNRNCRHHERELRYVIMSAVNHRCSLKDRFRRASYENISGFPQFRLTRLPWILLRGLCWAAGDSRGFPLSAGAEDRVPGGNRGSVEDQGPKPSWQVGGSAFLHHWEIWNDVRTDTLYVPYQAAQDVRQRRSDLGDPLCDGHEQLRVTIVNGVLFAQAGSVHQQRRPPARFRNG